jgi:hypothetical protein
VRIPKLGTLERSFRHAGDPEDPYKDVSATAHLSEPGDGRTRQIPLFWDGDSTWRFLFSPDRVGRWHWSTQGSDGGLDGHSGTFEVVPSDLKGSIRPMAGHPHHFERQECAPPRSLCAILQKTL